MRVPSIEVNRERTKASSRFTYNAFGEAQVILGKLVGVLNGCNEIDELQAKLSGIRKFPNPWQSDS